MLKQLLIFISLFTFFNLSKATENLLWVGYNQNSTDFFDGDDSQIKPDGIVFGYSRELTERLALTLSLSDFKGDVSAVAFENDQISLFNSGETESSLVGVSLSWLGDDFGLTFSFSQIDNTENSTVRLPLVVEKINGDDQILSFSYDNFMSSAQWNVGWSLGAQYALSEISLTDLISTNPVTEINAEFDNESWSAFVDLDFSYPIELESLLVSPQFTLSWAWELASSGDELVTISRNGRTVSSNSLNDRLATTFRTPDSGFWEMAVGFEWRNGWGATLAYGQSIAADQDIDSISFDVSVAF